MIVKSGNDYLIQVKANQKNLLISLQQIAKNQLPIDTHFSHEKSRGRDETRKVQLFKPAEIPTGWAEVNAVIFVERYTIRNKSPHYEQSFYISSVHSDDAKLFASAVRGHWSIENRLHWVKDVIQNEDDAAIKKENGIKTMSIFRTIAINVSREWGFDSIKYAQTYFASNVKELYKKIRT